MRILGNMQKIGGINYHIKEKGHGKAFIWAHGLLSSIEEEDFLDWYKHDEIAKHFRLIRYDALGHGKSGSSEKPDDYSWPELSLTVNSIAEKLNIDKYIVGGVSMGCATAIYAALKFPDKIKGLVLVNPPTAWDLRANQAADYNRMARLTGIFGGFFLIRLVSLISILKPGTILFKLLIMTLLSRSAKFKRNKSKPNRKILPIILRGAAMSDFPDKEKVSTINIPVLILAWTKDNSHPVEIAEELQRLLPNSELYIAKSYNDFLKWNDLKLNFLRKLN